MHEQQLKVYKEQVKRIQAELNNEKDTYSTLHKMHNEVIIERDKIKTTNTINIEKMENIKNDFQIEIKKRND